MFSVLLALCEGKPLVTGGFLSQRPVVGSFDVLFDLPLNKWLSKHQDTSDLRHQCAHYDVTVMNNNMLVGIACMYLTSWKILVSFFTYIQA